MARIRPQINPNTDIPNNPFFYPEEFYLNGPFGPLVIGSGLFIDFTAGTINSTGGGGGAVSQIVAGSGISVSPGSGTGIVTVSVPPSGVTAGTYTYSTINVNSQGIVVSASSGVPPVTSITAGTGLTGGTITSSGTIALGNTAVTPGSYTNASFTVSAQGRLTAASSGPTPVTSVTGTAPINVTAGGSPVVSIDAASTTGSGAVQLYDNTNSTSTTLALTAAQGKSLQDQINGLLVTGTVILAGTIDASTGLVASVTSSGTSLGYTVGAVLPTADATTNNSYVIVTEPGTMTPPGGSPTAATRGDWFLVAETSPGVYAWTFLNVGFDASAATTTVAGTVCLSTDALAQAGTDTTTALTPAAAASAYIPKTCVTAKGALITGTAANTPTALAVGTDGQSLVACAACPSGLTWAGGASIPCSLLTAKGNIIVASAASTPVALPVGTDGQSLVACAACSEGVTWASGSSLGDTPVGAVNWFASSAAPVGWIVADGSEVSRTGYAALFAVIGTTYGSGDGSTSFNLPDLRGQFIRGWDDAGGTARGCDPGRVFGSAQAGMVGPHAHDLRANTFDYSVSFNGSSVRAALGLASCQMTTGSKPNFTPYCFVCDPAVPTQSAIQFNAGTETRPMNVALLPCIKYEVTTAPLIPSSGIPCACITGKGALITGSSANSPTALPVGLNGQILVADSTCTLGMQWQTGAVGPWISAGTVQSVGFTSTGTTPGYGTTSTNDISYRQIGPKEWQVVGVYYMTAAGTNGTGDYVFTLPNSLSFDTTLPFQQVFTTAINSFAMVQSLPDSQAFAATDGNYSGFQGGIVPRSATTYRMLLGTTTNNNFWGALYRLGDIRFVKWFFSFTSL